MPSDAMADEAMAGDARPSNVVVLHNARLIDGTGGPAVVDAGVVIDGTTVAWAGPLAELPLTYASARRVDLAGRTICPGFIDTHVHFALPGRSRSVFANLRYTPSYRVLDTLERLRVTLHNGVTTARDLMGLDAGFRQAIAERKIPGPRLLIAIAMLSQHAGHADFTLTGGIDAYALGVAQPGAPANLVDSVDQMRLRVRELISAGADCIKLAASGGVTSPHDQPDWLGLRPEMIAAAVQEAQAYGGRPVAVHAIGRPGIEAAVHAGVTSIEHGYALDDQLRKEMVHRGQYLVPTLLETTADVDSAGPEAHAKSVHWHRVAQESFARSVAAGVTVAMGTDAGLTMNHGTNLKELGLMVRFGHMSAMDAIVAATGNAARLCGIDHLTGTVTAGKAADLVITDVDPLTDIDALGDPSRIHAVVKEGRLAIDRAAVFGPPGVQPALPALTA
jgi:imidazolonepropionase-like amidohydrolase